MIDRTLPAVYIYKADIWCSHCILLTLGLKNEKTSEETETVLDRLALYSRIDRTLEHTFDSDNFPKVAFEYWLREDDVCAGCGTEACSR